MSDPTPDARRRDSVAQRNCSLGTCERRAGAGRPRRWPAAAAKHRAHRARRAQRHRLVEELLLAVRNAVLEDPALHRAAQHGDDEALLHALVTYYQDRDWNHYPPR
jgi:hypothetical protein